MSFVWSWWYVVLALSIVGVVATIVSFVLMDKTDKKLVDKFISENTEQ